MSQTRGLGEGVKLLESTRQSEKKVRPQQPLLKTLAGSHCSDTAAHKALQCGPVNLPDPKSPSFPLTPLQDTGRLSWFPETPSSFLPLGLCISCSFCPKHFSHDCFLLTLQVSHQRGLLQAPSLDEIASLPEVISVCNLIFFLPKKRHSA